MSGRATTKKVQKQRPGEAAAADGAGAARRKSSSGVEKNGGSSGRARAAAEEEKKKAEGKAKRAAPPAASSAPLPDTPPEGPPERRASRSRPKRGGSTEEDPGKVLRDTLDKLKIKQSQRSEATRCVNEIQDAVARYVEESLDWAKDIKVLRTGSHYENVKICESNEFDVMLAVPVERVDTQPFGEDGAFYSVSMKRHKKHALDRFLNDDKTLKASEILQEFREKVKESVAKMSYVTVERKKQGCPAVTLQVKQNGTPISLDFVLGLEVHSSSWPSFTTNGFKIENWLGRKIKMDFKREPYYLVSKFEGKGTREHDGVIAKNAWRISFSHVEKAILKNHGKTKTCCEKQTPCCRKQCLKLLKYLLQKLKEKYPKEAKKLCSYHAKTTLLHACAARVEDSEWAANQLSHCFQQLLNDFEEHLRKCQLPNFFIPSHNLLKSAGLDKKTCDTLANYIEYERNNGFPLFRESNSL